MQVDVCTRSSAQRETCLALDTRELALDPFTVVEVRERFRDGRTRQEGERCLSCWFENKRLLATSSAGAAIDFAAVEPPCTRGGSTRTIDAGALTDWLFAVNLRVQAHLDNPRYLTRLASMQLTQEPLEGSVYRERCPNAEGGPPTACWSRAGVAWTSGPRPRARRIRRCTRTVLARWCSAEGRSAAAPSPSEAPRRASGAGGGASGALRPLASRIAHAACTPFRQLARTACVGR